MRRKWSRCGGHLPIKGRVFFFVSTKILCIFSYVINPPGHADISGLARGLGPGGGGGGVEGEWDTNITDFLSHKIPIYFKIVKRVIINT